MTGSVDTYLLMKEMEKDDTETGETPLDEEGSEFDMMTESDETNG